MIDRGFWSWAALRIFCGFIQGRMRAQGGLSRYVEVRRCGAPRPEWVYDGPFNAEAGRTGMTALLEAKERPTGVCCANDEIAFGVMDAASSKGWSCPGDISIVGFDDGLWATVCRPALTTVRQPLADLAERAVSLPVEAAIRTAPTQAVVPTNLPAALCIRDFTQIQAHA
jgi:DNA-binding LacI/PurR family transcriptional regulator